MEWLILIVVLLVAVYSVLRRRKLKRIKSHPEFVRGYVDGLEYSAGPYAARVLFSHLAATGECDLWEFGYACGVADAVGLKHPAPWGKV